MQMDKYLGTRLENLPKQVVLSSKLKILVVKPLPWPETRQILQAV